MSIEHYFFSFRNGNLKGKKKPKKPLEQATSLGGYLLNTAGLNTGRWNQYIGMTCLIHCKDN